LACNHIDAAQVPGAIVVAVVGEVMTLILPANEIKADTLRRWQGNDFSICGPNGPDTVEMIVADDRATEGTLSTDAIVQDVFSIW
jgi:hypothetical protein